MCLRAAERGNEEWHKGDIQALSEMRAKNAGLAHLSAFRGHTTIIGAI
jgi:hypothetical protein